MIPQFKRKCNVERVRKQLKVWNREWYKFEASLTLRDSHLDISSCFINCDLEKLWDVMRFYDQKLKMFPNRTEQKDRKASILWEKGIEKVWYYKVLWQRTNDVFEVLWLRTLPSNITDQENRKCLEPRTEHEERNKLKVKIRRINGIDSWPKKSKSILMEWRSNNKT